ncbi:MAG TPA: hypothetical protein VHE61_16525 [Opitutaceae bacterium]|nr:hypothetical protein [Opitutaceae bacterium]
MSTNTSPPDDLLLALGRFAAGATLEELERMMSPRLSRAAVVSTLAGLIESSRVRTDRTGRLVRYRLVETQTGSTEAGRPARSPVPPAKTPADARDARAEGAVPSDVGRRDGRRKTVVEFPGPDRSRPAIFSGAAAGPDSRESKARSLPLAELFDACVVPVVAEFLPRTAVIGYLQSKAMLNFPLVADRTAFVDYGTQRIDALTCDEAARYGVAREQYELWRRTYDRGAPDGDTPPSPPESAA